MKKINILSLSILLFISSFAIANEQDHMESNQIEVQAGSIDPNGTLMTVAVEGMVCDFCAQAIEKVFMKREEVAGITVNLDDQNVIISLKNEKDIENTIIEELFLNAGYNIQTIDRKKL